MAAIYLIFYAKSLFCFCEINGIQVPFMERGIL